MWSTWLLIPKVFLTTDFGFNVVSKFIDFAAVSLHVRIQESTFSRTHKVGNSGINANFVFPYMCSFIHYLYLKMLVNVYM